MSLLKELAGHPEWMAMLKELEKRRPSIPQWDPQNDKSVEEWKEASAMQKGFDLAMTVFRPK